MKAKYPPKSCTVKELPYESSTMGYTNEMAVSTNKTVSAAKYLPNTIFVSFVGEVVSIWLRQNHPDIFYITSYEALRGMYRGGDTSLLSPKLSFPHSSVLNTSAHTGSK
jgi:hypothetical protein